MLMVMPTMLLPCHDDNDTGDNDDDSVDDDNDDDDGEDWWVFRDCGQSTSLPMCPFQLTLRRITLLLFGKMNFSLLAFDRNLWTFQLNLIDMDAFYN